MNNYFFYKDDDKDTDKRKIKWELWLPSIITIVALVTSFLTSYYGFQNNLDVKEFEITFNRKSSLYSNQIQLISLLNNRIEKLGNPLLKTEFSNIPANEREKFITRFEFDSTNFEVNIDTIYKTIKLIEQNNLEMYPFIHDKRFSLKNYTRTIITNTNILILACNYLFAIPKKNNKSLSRTELEESNVKFTTEYLKVKKSINDFNQYISDTLYTQLFPKR